MWQHMFCFSVMRAVWRRELTTARASTQRKVAGSIPYGVTGIYY